MAGRLGLFSKTLRPAILAASRSHSLQHTAERLTVTRKVVNRFVPGETLHRVLDSTAALRDSRPPGQHRLSG